MFNRVPVPDTSNYSTKDLVLNSIGAVALPVLVYGSVWFLSTRPPVEAEAIRIVPTANVKYEVVTHSFRTTSHRLIE